MGFLICLILNKGAATAVCNGPLLVSFFPDIKDGNLKAILGLFFSLSRFKQQQKAASQQQQHNVNQNTVASDGNNPVTATNATSNLPKLSGRQTPNSNANTEMLSRSVQLKALLVMHTLLFKFCVLFCAELGTCARNFTTEFKKESSRKVHHCFCWECCAPPAGNALFWKKKNHICWSISLSFADLIYFQGQNFAPGCPDLATSGQWCACILNQIIRLDGSSEARPSVTASVPPPAKRSGLA